MATVLVKNAQQILQVCGQGERFLAGEAAGKLAQMESNGKEGLSMLIKDGVIADLGLDSEVSERIGGTETVVDVIDASGKCIVPGLVDGHVHPVWAGDRVHEFSMKLAGASYMEVHKAGGGINFTVEHTRKASEKELYDLLMDRLDRMIRHGTTTAECKSGYGLETETEVKMLKVLEKAKKNQPLEISSTFLGAHSVPKGKRAEEATKDVIQNQLAKVVRLNRTGQLNVENIDVFCEKGCFNVQQTKEILVAGREVGMRVNFHGEELSCLGSAEMGAEDLKAEAISHLEEVSDEGIAAMAKHGTVAVILPTTAYILRLPSPPVRKMIDGGCIVALGSDFNPNAFCLSMPTVMHLAAVNLRMSLSEAMAGATINAAHSIGRSETHGSIEKGKVGDFLIINAPRWEHLIYQFSEQGNVIEKVFKKGNVIYSKT